MPLSFSCSNNHNTSMEILIENLVSSWGNFRLTADTIIPGGKLVALLGPSGAGKSTLLHLIAGFLKPDSGRIYAGGRDITELPPHKRKAGLVFQDYALFPHLSVRGNIEFGAARGRKITNTDHNRRIEELHNLLELNPLLNRRPATLSGGEKQRTALGRALASGPDFLLLDEPFSALDPFLRGSLREELLTVQRKTGVTTLLVTHDQDEALSLADLIILFNDGRIIETGSPEQLYRNPENIFTARFLGEGNFIPRPDGSVFFFRPEDLEVSNKKAMTEEGTGTKKFSGVVKDVRFFGDRSIVKIHAKNIGEIIWQICGSKEPAAGEYLELTLKPGAGKILKGPDPST